MFKKVSAFITLWILALSVLCVSAQAASTEANDEFRLLKAFGFFEAVSESHAGRQITRGEFAKEAAFLTGYNGEEPIEYLLHRGAMSGDSSGNIREDDVITGYEAIKILVSSLGYDLDASKSGGYPVGYFITAQQLDMIPAGFSNPAAELTYSDAAALITGAGNAVVANHTYYVDNKIFTGGSENTAFYKYHNILVYQGIVNANEFTGFEAVPCGTDSVRIGSDVLLTEDYNANKYLGYYVKAYCVDRDGESVVKYIYPPASRNRATTINSDSEAVASGNLQDFTVTYYDENNKQKTIRVSDYYPFYNGKYYEGFSLDSISSVSGNIEFTDNDGDGICEIIKIFNYEYFVMQSVDPQKNILYDKYGKQLVLPEDENFCTITDSDGNAVTLEDIAENDILCVLRSEDGRLVEAQTIRRVASGTVVGKAIRNGKTIVSLTSDREYELSEEFESLVHKDKVEPEIGVHVQLRLDMNNKVIDVVLKSSDAWTYGFVTGANVNAEEDAQKWIRIYSQNKTTDRYNLPERLTIDGVVRRSEVAFNYLANPETREIAGQIIKYKLNGSTISAIDTLNPDGETDSLTRMTELDDMEMYYHNTTRMFFNGFETVVGGNSKTVVFNVPDSAAKYDDPSYFSVTGAGGIGSSTGYNAAGSTLIEAYDVDELNIAKVFLRRLSAANISVTRSSPHLIFKEFVYEVDANGEVRQKLVAVNPVNDSAYSKYVKEDIQIPELQFGDIIRYVERGDEVSQIKKDLADRFEFGGSLNKLSEGVASATSGRVNPDTDETYVATLNVYLGKLQYIGAEHISLSASPDGTGASVFMVNAKTPIYRCHSGRPDTLEKLTFNELKNYTSITNPDANTCVVTGVGEVKFIIVYTK